MMTPIKQGLPPRDLAHFRRLAEKHLPGQEQKIEDSLEIVGQLVDQGIGPLEPLSVENRIKVLKLAIETVPPRTDSTWMGQLAWWSLKRSRPRPDQRGSKQHSEDPSERRDSLRGHESSRRPSRFS